MNESMILDLTGSRISVSLEERTVWICITKVTGPDEWEKFFFPFAAQNAAALLECLNRFIAHPTHVVPVLFPNLELTVKVSEVNFYLVLCHKGREWPLDFIVVKSLARLVAQSLTRALASVDLERLQIAIEAVEAPLLKAQRLIPPAQKSRLIADAYRLLAESEPDLERIAAGGAHVQN